MTFPKTVYLLAIFVTSIVHTQPHPTPQLYQTGMVTHDSTMSGSAFLNTQKRETANHQESVDRLISARNLRSGEVATRKRSPQLFQTGSVTHDSTMSGTAFMNTRKRDARVLKRDSRSPIPQLYQIGTVTTDGTMSGTALLNTRKRDAEHSPIARYPVIRERNRRSPQLLHSYIFSPHAFTASRVVNTADSTAS
ncbi:hypothetical protein Ddc_17493 [Ditylenchus destructor]|nr:hypothetical protein Ddc_17493 [Ditylenchus destructor]